MKKSRFSPQQISRWIRKELVEVLLKNSADIDPEGLKVLENRINQINQITNKARLGAPSELFGITLNSEV